MAQRNPGGVNQCGLLWIQLHDAEDDPGARSNSSHNTISADERHPLNRARDASTEILSPIAFFPELLDTSVADLHDRASF